MLSKPKYVKLSELILEKPRNGLYKGKEFQGRGHRWIKMNEVYGNNFFLAQVTELLEVNESEIKRFNCQVGDLLFGRTSLTLEGIGDCLIVGNVADIPIFESNLFRVRFNLEIAYPLFYYYFFKSKIGILLIQTIAKQTAATSITSTDLIGLPVPYLPVELQKDIADQLSLFDKKIELNRQTNKTLEQMAQAIFKSWFVDFEPTRAKIAAKLNGQDPERAAMTAVSGKLIEEIDQLSPDTQQQLRTTAALFPDKLVDSELGEIPEGWEVKSLSSIIKLTGGGTPKRSEQAFWNGDIPWFSIKDIPGASDVFVVDTVEKISQVGLNKSSTKLLPKGTTIISARGTVGKLALVATPMCMNQSCYGINGVEGIGPYFNYFNLREAISTLQRNTHGAVFDTITTQTFESYSMAIRIDELTQMFDHVVNPMMERIQSNVWENISLIQVRDSLLPELLTGKLKVSGIHR